MKPLRTAPCSNLVINDMSPPPCNYEKNNNSYDIREELHEKRTYITTTCLYIGKTVNCGTVVAVGETISTRDSAEIGIE